MHCSTLIARESSRRPGGFRARRGAPFAPHGGGGEYRSEASNWASERPRARIVSLAAAAIEIEVGEAQGARAIAYAIGEGGARIVSRAAAAQVKPGPSACVRQKSLQSRRLS